MTIFVDELRQYQNRSGKWCHMMTDQDDLTELHAMAQQLGVRRYFQNHPHHPHYDIMRIKRQEAITLGATSTTSTEMVRKCSKIFKDDKQ